MKKATPPLAWRKQLSGESTNAIDSAGSFHPLSLGASPFGARLPIN